MRPVILLLTAGGLCASAAAASTPSLKRVKKAQAEIQQITDRLKEQSSELQEIRIQYTRTKKTAPIDSRRTELRAEMTPALKLLDSKNDDFRDLTRAIQLQNVSAAFQQIYSEGVPVDASGAIGEAVGWEAFIQKSSRFHHDVDSLIKRELLSYEETKSAVRHKRLMIAAAAGLLASLLAGLLITFFYGKRTAGTTGAVTLDPAAALGENFEIKGEIGRGGMGVVYEARDKNLGRRVAVKVLHEHAALSPKERERFLAEARLVAALRHPGIVEIHQILDRSAGIYLIFEYINGISLFERIRDQGPVLFPEAKTILEKAAAAVDYAHDRGIIHRDIKPANIMLCGGEVKVMDFGIARRSSDDAGGGHTQTIEGSPPYMAPEQLQGAVRRESDVYMLAICLYEMLTGKLPFPGKDLHMLSRKLKGDFVPIKMEGLPEDLNTVFKRALDPDPAKRYPSAGELVQAVNLP